MKRIIAMLLALVMTLCLVACSEEKSETKTTEAPATEAPATEAPATEAPATEPTATEAAASDMADILANGKFVVGITEYEPMDYMDENGEWTGFDAELARMFAEEMGVEIEFFVIADWGMKFLELETKNIDAVWNGMTITEEAMLNSSVSDPYVLNAQVVVMQGKNVEQYTSIESLAELTIAVEDGSAGQAAAQEAGLENLIAVQDQANALLEVAAGTADACVIDITMANAMTGEGTDYSDLAAGISLTEEEYGVAFRVDSDMTEAFNEFLAAKREDGTLEALAEKYQLTLAE